MGSTGLVAPSTALKTFGVSGRHRAWARGIGVRDVLIGTALIEQPHRFRWRLMRLISDATDMVLMVRTFSAQPLKTSTRQRLAVAGAAVTVMLGLIATLASRRRAR